MKIRALFMILVLTPLISGCASVNEFTKSIWGSSTSALEKARSKAISKTYDQGYWDLMKTTLEVVQKKSFVIFKKDEVRGYLVLMGIPGAVNTTEVGVFFVEETEKKTRIEVASLSTNAKRRTAKDLFLGLDIAYGLVALPVAELEPVQE